MGLFPNDTFLLKDKRTQGLKDLSENNDNQENIEKNNKQIRTESFLFDIIPTLRKRVNNKQVKRRKRRRNKSKQNNKVRKKCNKSKW